MTRSSELVILYKGYCLCCSALWSSATDSLGLWSLEVSSWNPTLIVALVSEGCTGGDSWAIGTNDGDLLAWVDWLRATAGTLRTLATFAAALFLWEEGGNPGVVDEIDCATERSEEDQVEEDATAEVSVCRTRPVEWQSYI